MFNSYLSFIKKSLSMLFKGNIANFGDYVYAVLGLMGLLLSIAGFILFIGFITIGPVKIYRKMKSITEKRRKKISKIAATRRNYTDKENKRIMEIKNQLNELNKNNKKINDNNKELNTLLKNGTAEYLEIKKDLKENNKKKEENVILINKLDDELTEIDNIIYRRGKYTEEELEDLKKLNNNEKTDLIVYIIAFVLIYVPIVLPLILMFSDWAFSGIL